MPLSWTPSWSEVSPMKSSGLLPPCPLLSSAIPPRAMLIPMTGSGSLSLTAFEYLQASKMMHANGEDVASGRTNVEDDILLYYNGRIPFFSV